MSYKPAKRAIDNQDKKAERISPYDVVAIARATKELKKRPRKRRRVGPYEPHSE